MITKELRIGNYINIVYGDNATRVVESVSKENVIHTNQKGGDPKESHFSLIKPIALNNGVLEFSFPENSCRLIRMYDGRYVFEIRYENLGETTFTVDWRAAGIVKYVHELQNIFFCVYGKELEIK